VAVSTALEYELVARGGWQRARAVASAWLNAGMATSASGHTLGDSYVAHPPEDSDELRTDHGLLGYTDLRTTSIDIQVLHRRPARVRSPLDGR